MLFFSWELLAVHIACGQAAQLTVRGRAWTAAAAVAVPCCVWRNFWLSVDGVQQPSSCLWMFDFHTTFRSSLIKHSQSVFARHIYVSHETMTICKLLPMMCESDTRLNLSSTVHSSEQLVGDW